MAVLPTITDEQLVRVIRDSVHTEPDPEMGHSYHQSRELEVEINEYGIAMLGDSFYGIPIDLARLRKGLASIGLCEATTTTTRPMGRFGKR